MAAGKRTSVYLPADVQAEWRRSGLKLVDVVRRGLGLDVPVPVDAAAVARALVLLGEAGALLEGVAGVSVNGNAKDGR